MTPPAHRGRAGLEGYLLVETAVALVLLSMGAYVIHGTIQQALVTRGQAQDYTQARFLIEQVMSQIELQPRTVEGTQSGQFTGAYSRFSWSSEVSRVDIPKPEPPGNLPEGWVAPATELEYPVPYLMHAKVTLKWQRAGEAYSEFAETLFNSAKLWQPPNQGGAGQ